MWPLYQPYWRGGGGVRSKGRPRRTWHRAKTAGHSGATGWREGRRGGEEECSEGDSWGSSRGRVENRTE